MKKNKIKQLTLSAMFLAMAFVMPFLTGQIPQIGSMLCPMHIPVLLCGFFCGAPWGLIVGFIAPILRSFTLGMPPLFPKAFCMAFELATYGFISGWLHHKLRNTKINVYLSLLCAMIAGRFVWGIAMFSCMNFDSSKFNINTFLSGIFLNSIPGIILQIIFIPILVITLEKYINKSE